LYILSAITCQAKSGLQVRIICHRQTFKTNTNPALSKLSLNLRARYLQNLSIKIFINCDRFAYLQNTLTFTDGQRRVRPYFTNTCIFHFEVHFRQNQLNHPQQDDEVVRELTIKLISCVNTNHIKLHPVQTFDQTTFILSWLVERGPLEGAVLVSVQIS
jgi:hypothetical protein